MSIAKNLIRSGLLVTLISISHPAPTYQLFTTEYLLTLSLLSAQYLISQGQILAPGIRIEEPDSEGKIVKVSKDGYLKVYRDPSITSSDKEALVTLCAINEIASALECHSRAVHGVFPKNGCFYPENEEMPLHFDRSEYYSVAYKSPFLCYRVRSVEADGLLLSWNNLVDQFKTGSHSTRGALFHIVVNKDERKRIHSHRKKLGTRDPGQAASDCTHFYHEDFDNAYGTVPSLQHDHEEL